MSYLITEADETLPQKSLVTLIFAEPGIGKTSLAFTSEDPILFDYDQGVQRCVGRKRTVSFKSWDDTLSFIKDGQLEKLQPQTIICDTAGTMLDDYIGNYVIKQNVSNEKKGGGVSLQGYGAMKEVFKRFVIGELRMRGIDLIIIAHSKDVTENDLVRKAPEVTGGSYGILMAKCDLVGYMTKERDDIVLDFNPTEVHKGKNCAEFPKLIVPHYSTPEYKTFMGDVIQKTKDHMSAMNHEQKMAIEFIEKEREVIESITVKDDLISRIKDYDKKSETYKAQLNKLLKDRFIELYVKELGEFKASNEFNTQIAVTSTWPESLSKDAKRTLLEVARDKGILFNTDKKCFVDPETPDQEVSSDESPEVNVEEKVKEQKRNEPNPENE